MRYDLIGRTHDPGPCVAIIADWMQAKGTQPVGTLFALAHCYRWPTFAEQVCYRLGLIRGGCLAVANPVAPPLLTVLPTEKKLASMVALLACRGGV